MEDIVLVENAKVDFEFETYSKTNFEKHLFNELEKKNVKIKAKTKATFKVIQLMLTLEKTKEEKKMMTKLKKEIQAETKLIVHKGPCKTNKKETECWLKVLWPAHYPKADVYDGSKIQRKTFNTI